MSERLRQRSTSLLRRCSQGSGDKRFARRMTFRCHFTFLEDMVLNDRNKKREVKEKISTHRWNREQRGQRALPPSVILTIWLLPQRGQGWRLVAFAFWRNLLRASMTFSGFWSSTATPEMVYQGHSPSLRACLGRSPDHDRVCRTGG